MKAKEIDMLHGSLWDKILIFAFPLALTVFFQQLYNTADTAIVGRFVSSSAMAAVGTNVPIVAICVNLFFGVSLGANVMIARYIGSGDENKARQSVHSAVLLALMVGCSLLVIGQLASGWIMSVLDVPDEIRIMAETYLRVYLIGMPMLALYNVESAIFRSRGDTSTPLMALFVASALNCVLDFVAAGVMGFGIAGVAMATVIAQSVSAIILFVALRRTSGVVRLSMHELHFNVTRVGEILEVGIPAAIQAVVFSLSNVVIQSAINSLGTDVMAASSAAFTLEINIYCIIASFSQAATTFVSQNYGAGNMSRCRRATVLSFFIGNGIMLMASAFVYIFGESLMSLFDSDPEVIRLGMIRIFYVVCFESLNGVMDILSGALRGYGYSLPPALLALIGICGVRLAWVWLVFPFRRAFDTLMMCYPISWAVACVLIAMAYVHYTKKIKPMRVLN
ncbi:MAG: MATE family efflux transporter [Selenomonadaceae bacterium]